MTGPEAGSVRRRFRAPALGALLLVGLFLASSSVGLSAPSALGAPALRAPALVMASSGPAHLAASAHPAPLGVRPAAEHAASTVTTTATIDLYNHSALLGNVRPRYVNDAVGIAYNPINHLEMITGSESACAVLFNPTTGVVQSFPQPLVNGTGVGAARMLSGVQFDPANNLTYVADETDSTVLVYQTSVGGAVSFLKTIHLPAGDGPAAFALDDAFGANRLFVGDVNNSTVSVINGATNNWITDIGVGSDPASLVYDPIQNTVFVANYASDNITWIDATRLTTGGGFGSTFAVPGNPAGIALAPTQDIIWTIESGYLTALNATSRATSVNYTLTSAAPTGVFWDSVQNEIYATNAPSGAISVFNMSGVKLTAGVPSQSNAKKPALTIQAGGMPSLAASDPALAEVDLLDLAANSVVRIPDSTQTVLGRTSLGAEPQGMAFNPVTDQIMVADAASNRVYEVNVRNTTPGTDPVVGNFLVPGHPSDICYDADTGWLIVAANPGVVLALDPVNGSINASVHLGSVYTLYNVLCALHQIFVTASGGWFFVFNATTLIKTQEVQIGSGDNSAPRMAAYDTKNGNLYIALEGDNAVAVVNAFTDHESTTFASPGGPIAIAYDPIGDHLFVVGAKNANVTVMNPANGAAIRQVQVGYQPDWIAYNPYAQDMYVASARSDSVTVIDPSFLAPGFDVAVGDYPQGMAVSPVTGDLFVSDQASSSLSVLPVNAPLPAAFNANVTVSPGTTDIGVAATVSVRASLPAWGLSYAYPTLPSGCASANTAVLSCKPDTVGSGEIIDIQVSNMAGDTLTLTSSLNVNPDPLIPSFTAVPGAITLTRTVTLNATVIYGVPPYKYVYSGVPQGCGMPTTAQWQCTPLDPSSNYEIGVTVTDAVHFPVFAQTNFTANYIPQVTVNLSSASVSVGAKLVITVSIAHGTAPFSYSYADLPAGCQSANANPLVCFPSAAGSFTVKVTVIDNSGYSQVASASLTILGASSSSSSNGSLLLIGILVIVIVAALGVGLFLYRRSRPAPVAPKAPEEGEAVEIYGTGSTARPPTPTKVEDTSVAGQAPSAGMPAETGSVAPKYYEPAEPEAAPQPLTPTPAFPSGARPPVKCPHCGQMNQPWLTNCRNCSWPLAET
jgi:YVTN family beta-propeller protein